MLKRRDFAGWAASKELAATIHNIVARRTQMWHVHRYLVKSKHAHQIADSLQSISPGDFVRAALAAGDCESIRSALRKKNIDTTVKDILKSMDVALRGVEGSESERDIFRFKFISLHIWSGCSMLFWTMNPHDIKHPLLLVFLGHQGVDVERISLDWNDDEMTEEGKPLCSPRTRHATPCRCGALRSLDLRSGTSDSLQLFWRRQCEAYRPPHGWHCSTM